jgi:hypothetical protein
MTRGGVHEVCTRGVHVGRARAHPEMTHYLRARCACTPHARVCVHVQGVRTPAHVHTCAPLMRTSPDQSIPARPEAVAQ